MVCMSYLYPKQGQCFRSDGSAQILHGVSREAGGRCGVVKQNTHTSRHTPRHLTKSWQQAQCRPSRGWAGATSWATGCWRGNLKDPGPIRESFLEEVSASGRECRRDHARARENKSFSRPKSPRRAGTGGGRNDQSSRFTNEGQGENQTLSSSHMSLSAQWVGGQAGRGAGENTEMAAQITCLRRDEGSEAARPNHSQTGSRGGREDPPSRELGWGRPGHGGEKLSRPALNMVSRLLGISCPTCGDSFPSP